MVYSVNARKDEIKSYRVERLNRKALLMTDTELKLMSSATIMSDNNRPAIGSKTPATRWTAGYLVA